MNQVVSLSRPVRRPAEVVAAVATDPSLLFPLMPGFGRFAPVGPGSREDTEEWDVFLDVGTYNVGGRVEISRPDARTLRWSSLRGTRNDFTLHVEPDPEHVDRCTLTMTMGFSLSGLLVARIAALLARGIVVRHLEAGLEQLRHHLEYGG